MPTQGVKRAKRLRADRDDNRTGKEVEGKVCAVCRGDFIPRTTPPQHGGINVGRAVGLSGHFDKEEGGVRRLFVRMVVRWVLCEHAPALKWLASR